jgi:malonyl CoA-acyl carrier protein transacylase
MKASVQCWKAGSKAELASMVQAARRGQRPRSSHGGQVRLGVAYRGTSDLREKLERAEAMFASGVWNDSSGLYCRTLTAPPSIAFLYPGQGSQAVNMLSGLRSALPEFDGHLRRLDSMQRTLSNTPLLPLIYTDHSPEAKERLRNTRTAQPALGLVETAARLSLESLGVRASFHAGHSYGELPALCGAGYLDESLMFKLSLERGHLLDFAGQSRPGGMAALAASYEDVKALCERSDKRLEVANINAARQIVVAGPLDSIALLEKAAAGSGISARRLATSCAFHSSLMASVAPRWRHFLANALPAASATAPGARAFSNVTARPYETPAQLPDLLASQIVEPVRWADTCGALLKEGANIFIEVGPGRTLSDLMSRNAGPAAPLTLVMDPFDTDADQHLADLLAQLAAAGVDPQGERFVDFPTLRQDTVMPASTNTFFETNRDAMERYFAQQTSLVELALCNAAAADRTALTQSALVSNQKIMSEFLTAQENVARWALGGNAADLPAAAHPQTAIHIPADAVANPRPADPATNVASPAVDLPKRIEAELRAAISETTGFPAESIDEHAAFSHLGIDSLTMAEIWAAVGNRIPEITALADRVLEVRTIADVASLCDGPAGPRKERVSADEGASTVPACPPAAADNTSRSNWSVVRAQLVGAISAATGVAGTRILASSDFDRDLGLDVFRLEEIFARHLFNHPLFGQAGRALLNARNLSDLETLLARFDAPVVEEPKSAGEETGKDEGRADGNVNGAEKADEHEDDDGDENRVRRFVLRERGLPSAGDAWECPPAVLLAADAPSPETDCLRNLMTSCGSSVTFVRTTDDMFREAVKSDTRQILFLAQNGSAATALFALAKSLWGRDDRHHRTSRLAVIGSHAYGPEARGAIGVARSLRRELPHIAIRTVWLQSRIADAEKDALMGALFSPRVDGDVALTGQRLTRETLETVRRRTRAGNAVSGLDRDSRILVLGGGDGISAEIAVGLAKSYGCEILAVGRTPWPDSLPYPEVQDGPDAAQRLKRVIINDGAAEGRRADVLQQRWKLASRQRALWSTKMRVVAAGGRFSYASADITDPEACAAVIRRFQSAGPIHGVIHGAGIVCDNLLPRKPIQEFRTVVHTKTVPARVLRELLAAEPLRFVFFLSSMTSFTGTAGQTDYAAGNEILNAFAHDWNNRAAYPVKSLLWSVWTEAGLASAVLKRHMTKLGLGGIRTADGVRLLLNELTHGQKTEDWVLFAPDSTLHYSMGSVVTPSLEAGPIGPAPMTRTLAAHVDAVPVAMGRA